jgi:hypothetical protein
MVVTTSAHFNDVNYYQLLRPAEDLRTYCELVFAGRWQRSERIPARPLLPGSGTYYMGGVVRADADGGFEVFSCTAAPPAVPWHVSVSLTEIHPADPDNQLSTALGRVSIQPARPPGTDAASRAALD